PKGGTNMPNIRERLLIAAPRDTVYAALTTKEGLSMWWTPDVEATPKVGTIAHFEFAPPYFKEMKITALKPGEHVEWECVEGADEWKGTTLTFQLESCDRNALSKAHPEMSDQVAQQTDNAATLLMFGHDNWR